MCIVKVGSRTRRVSATTVSRMRRLEVKFTIKHWLLEVSHA